MIYQHQHGNASKTCLTNSPHRLRCVYNKYNNDSAYNNVLEFSIALFYPLNALKFEIFAVGLSTMMVPAHTVNKVISSLAH